MLKIKYCRTSWARQWEASFGGPHRNVLLSLIISSVCVRLSCWCTVQAQAPTSCLWARHCPVQPRCFGFFSTDLEDNGASECVQKLSRVLQCTWCQSSQSWHKLKELGTWNKWVNTLRLQRAVSVRNRGPDGWQEWGSSTHSSSLPTFFLGLVIRHRKK